MGSDDYSEFDETTRRKSSRRKFNTKLDIDHLAVSENDHSFRAQLIRTMASGISQFVTPRQLISLLFVVAAYTTVFLIATIFSDLVFIYYELFYDFSDEVKLKLGSDHDVKIRLFSAVFSVLAIMVELDRPFIGEKISILKSFIPRSGLLFFVATLSEMNPMIAYEWTKFEMVDDDDVYNSMVDDFNPNQSYFDQYNSNSYSGNSYNSNSYNSNSYSGNSYKNNAYKSSYSGNSYNSNSYNNNYSSNNGYGNNNYSSNNSYGNNYNTNNYTTSSQSSTDDAEIYIRDEMPNMAIHLQSISATLLKVSVYLYLLLGLLCLDQFKPNAFVPPNDRKLSPEHLPRELSGKKSSRSRNIDAEDRRSNRSPSRPRNLDAEDRRNSRNRYEEEEEIYNQQYESPVGNYAQYPGPGYA